MELLFGAALLCCCLFSSKGRFFEQMPMAGDRKMMSQMMYQLHQMILVRCKMCEGIRLLHLDGEVGISRSCSLNLLDSLLSASGKRKLVDRMQAIRIKFDVL